MFYLQCKFCLLHGLSFWLNNILIGEPYKTRFLKKRLWNLTRINFCDCNLQQQNFKRNEPASFILSKRFGWNNKHQKHL